jgi:protein-tyrosine phosphatase
MREAVELCRMLVADGITDVVATPHQLGRYDGRNTAAVVRESVKSLCEELERERVALRVTAGGDVRVDERIPSLLRRDEILTVGDGGKYLLLELPHEVFVDPLRLILALRGDGVWPILTHPERYPSLQRRPELMAPWLEAGAVVQLTAGSFVGDFGSAARQSAWRMLRRGWVSVVASDAHDAQRRPPRMSAAIEAISREVGRGVARRLCIDNPLRVLKGQALFTYAALTAGGAA